MGESNPRLNLARTLIITLRVIVRIARIELALLAWEASVMPLDYTRKGDVIFSVRAWEGRVIPLN